MENKVKLHRTRHNKTKSDVNNNVISVFVNFKRYFILIYQFNKFNSNKTKITKPPLLQHQNNSKSNSLSDTMNIITKKRKLIKLILKQKHLPQITQFSFLNLLSKQKNFRRYQNQISFQIK